MKALGLDLGERRIGVAVSDPTGTLARPLTALERRGPDADLAAVLELARREGAQAIVVGLPFTLRGEEGPQAHRVQAFVAALRAHSPLPVETWDERLTTVEAERRLREAGRKPSRERERVDAASAALLLQAWLDARRLRREEAAPGREGPAQGTGG